MAGGSPWRLALVLASGPLCSSSASSCRWAGTRTDRVSPPRGTANRNSPTGSTSESGPGQNALANRAAAGVQATMRSS